MVSAIDCLISKNFNEEWRKKVENERKRVASLREQFKQTIVENGAHFFEVEYCGEHDSGEIVSVIVRGKDGDDLETSIDVGEWERWCIKEMKYETVNCHQPIADYVENYIYEMLEAECPGWEINEGQKGKFVWDGPMSCGNPSEIIHDYYTMIETNHMESY